MEILVTLLILIFANHVWNVVAIVERLIDIDKSNKFKGLVNGMSDTKFIYEWVEWAKRTKDTRFSIIRLA